MLTKPINMIFRVTGQLYNLRKAYGFWSVNSNRIGAPYWYNEKQIRRPRPKTMHRNYLQ